MKERELNSTRLCFPFHDMFWELSGKVLYLAVRFISDLRECDINGAGGGGRQL